jgi:predicted DNA-binding WGR domain protein
MRRFELVEGTSSKFWEVEVEGSELTVTFGRIGTHGQTKSKTFASNAAALAEKAKLIKEKTGKGYKEVTAADVTTAPAPAAMSGSDPEPAEPADPKPPPVPTEPRIPASAVPAAAAIEWPTGGFKWTAELRSQLPIIRGIHVPEAKEITDCLLTRPSFAAPTADEAQRYIQEQWTKLAQALGLQGKTLWTDAEASEMLKIERLHGAEPSYWREILAQAAARRNCWQRHQRDWTFQEPSEPGVLSFSTTYATHWLHWAVQAACAAHSLAFATRVVLDTGDILEPYGLLNALKSLRYALAAAPEDAHQAALRVAEEFRGQARGLDCIILFLFPEQREWAEECVARGLSRDESRWLNKTILSVEAARALQVIEFPTVLLQLYLHDEVALPILEFLLDSGWGDTVLNLLVRLRSPALFPVLAARIENQPVRDILNELADLWPAAVFESILTRATIGQSPEVEKWMVQLATRKREYLEPILATRAPTERKYFETLLAPLRLPEAPPDALPELLRNPPWAQTDRPQPVPTLALTPLEQTEEMIWPEGLRDRWRSYEPAKWCVQQWLEAQKKNPKLTAEQHYLRQLDILDSAHERVLAGKLLGPDDIAKKAYYYNSPDSLLMLPDAAATAAWNSLPPSIWNTWDAEAPIRALLARHEMNCLQGLVTYASAHPEDGLGLALPFRSPRLAPLAAHALKNLKKARANAMQWLRAHPETAITALIPPAFGKDRVPRENAQATLRWLAQNGFEAEVRRIGTRYGEAAADAVDQLLGADPALIVPARMPKLPAFFVPAALRRPVLNTGGALSLPAVEHLGRMLTISSLHEPYAGLEVVKSACTRDSLAEFAWDIFEAWMGAGAPSKEGWAFTALGLLGDDETARRLAPKIREWPGESAHARAVTGLDLLAAIGSDVALMHLNGIAGKVKFKGLQDKAREKIAQVAETRGLTPEELADRLVPDLGLDATGSVALDFGPRRFFVAFDEALKPYVKDESGARLKDLPKPNRNDQAELAEAAVERYKALKKDAKAIASLQIIRLEQIMCARRRWSGEDFRLFFLDHPLMRHLARRLVWGVYRDGKFVEAFRVAEDLTLADRQDDLYELPADVEVGIAHVLEMPEDLGRDFGQIFADYEILQPFRQLGRETYALTDEERRTGTIERFKARKVATGSVMGLINRGWERGEAQDGGWVGWFTKRLPGNLEAELQLDPGTVVGDLSFEPEQSIPSIMVRRRGTWGTDGLADLAGLDPILVSEIIRDADLLAPPDKK